MSKTIQTECSCRGRNAECPFCKGTGRRELLACKRCNGSGKEGGANCLDCRGQGWRSLDQVDPFESDSL